MFGALIGLLTIRLGDLYVAIVTLTFGSLVEGLVFTRDRFVNGGLGVTVHRPGFAQTDFAFSYLGLAVFAVIALLIVNLRRSTSGMALRAVRDSETASRMLGLSVIQVKVIIGAIGAFIAAVGGGFLAMYAENAQPTSFDIFLGMIWLAVAVTWGVRSITGAALAGITLSIMPGIFATYIPVKWAVVPSVLFGLGAVSVARNPEGVIAQYARQLSDLIPGCGRRNRSRRRRKPPAVAGRSGVAPMTTPTSDVNRLECSDVTVRFGGLVALKQAHLAVPRGATIGLVGPNGAGKSTLFGVLSGLLKPSSGTVRLDGEDVTGLRPQGRAARGLARTFQHPELFTGLTVREHLALAHRARKAKSRSGRTWSRWEVCARPMSPRR